MNRWWRCYDEALDEPKLIKLSDAVFRMWWKLLCVASRNEGFITNNLDDLSIMVRSPVAKIREAIKVLVAATLLDDTGNGYAPHNWNGRQYKSDVSTERVKRFRQMKRNVSSAVAETPPEAETETEQSRAEQNAVATGQEFSDRLGKLQRILGIAGAGPIAEAANVTALSQLLAEGCDFERDILPAAERAAAKRPNSLRYIAPAALASRDAARKLATLPTPFEDADEHGWRHRLHVFGEGRWWPKWGPPPTDPGCKCWPALLTEWREKQPQPECAA